MSNPIIMSGLNYKLIDSLQTDNIVVNIIFALFIGTLMQKLMNYDYEDLFSYIKDIIPCCKNKSNQIKFITNFDHRKTARNSLAYKAIMHFISTNKNNSVYKLKEQYERDYCYESDKWENDDYYQVNQNNFKITNDINGEINVIKNSEKNSDGSERQTKQEHFTICSDTLSLLELQKWVTTCRIKYDEYLKKKLDTTKNIIICSWDNKDKYFKIECREWVTTSDFKNKFFENKDEIVNRIIKFEKGEDFYKKKGLEYQFGIMLSGEPGCGKTTFIKCVSKLTQRIIIIVKWSNDSDLEELSKLILGTRIGDYSIPHSKRLWVFEDIDAMGDIVRDRDLVEREKHNREKAMLKLINQIDDNLATCENKLSDNKKTDTSIKLKKHITAHNNLSTYLNMIQGIEESHGRMIIITTNKPDSLDKAVTRPGRIDANIIMKKASDKIILDILNNYWDTNWKINSIPKNLHYKFTHAEIIGKCRTSNSIHQTLQYLLKQCS